MVRFIIYLYNVSMLIQTLDSETLINWFEEEKRSLPWRDHPSPYVVWVSEVMLQQTQVSVVIPYFERWMRRFPTISDLASASLDEVIKLWEGLGYYSRARNLLEGAKTVCTRFGGELPESENELAAIKGLGPYTVGAIRSFAFHKRAVAVDGNVLRVASRYFQIEEDISKGSVVKKIRDTIEKALPEDKHWMVNEALIELGATVCIKKPNCQACPLKKNCLSFRNGLTDKLPFKSLKTTSIPLYRAVAVICKEQTYLVKREKNGKIMQDLHEFPYFEAEATEVSINDISKEILKLLGIKTNWIKPLATISHSFTKYRVKLEPHLFSTYGNVSVEGYHWKSISELNQLAFSAGHRKILKELTSSG